MNIVDTIQQELTGGMLDKLSSFTGQGEMKTKTAAAAAVPTILSALGGLASTSGGAEKLAAMARKFTPEEMKSLPGMTTGQSAAMFDESKSALTGLLEGNTLGMIVSVLQKFTGFDAGTVKKLLGFLTPVILGSLTKKFGAQGLTGSTVSALFAEQKDNIANAMPAGLSLGNIPGLPNIGGAAKAAAGSSMGMLLPLLLVLGIGAAGYWYFFMRPQNAPVVEVPKGKLPDAKVTDAKVPEMKLSGVVNMLPEVSKFSTQINDIVSPLTDAFKSVKDAASAEAAIPKLKGVGEKVGGLKAAFDKIPEAGKAPAKKLLADAIAKLKGLADTMLALPGVGDKLKPTIDDLMAKLNALVG